MAEWKHPGDTSEIWKISVETFQKGEGKDKEVKNIK